MKRKQRAQLAWNESLGLSASPAPVVKKKTARRKKKRR